MNSDNPPKKEKKVSISMNNSNDIQPVTYSFRIPNQKSAFGSVTTANKPPPWLYHDHALGVIWMLFHKDKNYVGIAQLHWCLRFLLNLKNSQGEYTGDVKICIQAIEDDLIEQYSKLGSVLEMSIEEKSSERKKLSKVPDEAIDAILDAERTEDAVRNESIIANRENESNIPNDDEHEISEEITDEIQGTSTPKEEKARSLKIGGKEESGNSTNKIQSYEEKCSSRCAGRGKEEIVSFTYKDMKARGIAPVAREYLIEDMFDNSFFLEETMGRINKENRPEGTANGRTDLDSSELANFLNSSRKQHLQIIKKEILQLYGLEKFMENIEPNDFSAYVTEDLARRVENLRDEEIVKAAEEIMR